MTPINFKFYISEIIVWLFFGLVALALALPLAMRQHQVRLGDLVSLPFGTPRTYGSTGDGSPLPQTYLKYEPHLTLSRLGPNPELFDILNVASHVRPVWNAAVPNYEDMIEKAARQYQVSPILVKAVIQAESNFNPQAISHRGAVGLMQVMPATGRSVGIGNLSDPQSNITAGVKYLKELLILFNDDERLAVAAYNCGPEAMRRWDNQPPYKETIDFVDRVMAYYNYHLNG